MAPSEPVALVHDYLTQRGGAERVVLAMARALPPTPIWTSLYDPDGTFAEFEALDVRTTWIDHLAPLRHHHRLALPLLANAFSNLHVDAPAVLCSSSGWAHGVSTEGRKVVYCHSPARWLYQTDRYLESGRRDVRSARRWGRARVQRAALGVLRPHLTAWDHAAAASADRYLVGSSAVARSVKEIYGIEAEILPPPPALDPHGPISPVEGLRPGFWLCVSRLMPYKNVDAVVRAVLQRRGERLVVVGEGPDRAALRALGDERIVFTGRLADDQLRWCYANCRGLVAASYEDFGLTPLEAAAFGKASAVLRFGGFLDTVVEGTTGCFFERPDAGAIAAALEALDSRQWDEAGLVAQADRFGEARFARRLRQVMAEGPGHDLGPRVSEAV